MLQIDWPTTRQTKIFHALPVDQFVQITEGIDQYTPLALRKLKFGSSSGSR